MKTIKKQLKRAFTIVELVIVIAVVAALAAILIPTFVNVVGSANEASDTILAKNLDTSLVTIESKLEKNNGIYNVTEALTLVRNDGYDVSKLTPTADGADYVYNATTNRFLYYTDDFSTLSYGEEPTATDTLIVIDSDLTRVGMLSTSATIQYCVYSTEETVTVENTTASNITVWIYAESGSSVTINVPSGTIYQFGDCASTVVEEVDGTNSWHLYGSVETLKAKKGHIVYEDDSNISDTIYYDIATSGDITVTQSSKANITKKAFSTVTLTIKDSEGNEISEEDSGVTVVGSDVDFDNLDTVTYLTEASNTELTTGTYALANNITGNFVIAENAVVVIDLNGYTIKGGNTGTYAATFYNKGNLTIEGSGNVTCLGSGEDAAVYSAYGAKTYLDGGTYRQGTWYLLHNWGYMEINDAMIIGNSKSSSVVHNGYYDYSKQGGTNGEAVMVINGLSFSNDTEAELGTSSLIKNDDMGNLTINGGTFNEAPSYILLNWNVCTINDGYFSGVGCIGAYGANSDIDKGELTINGGTFVNSTAGYSVIYANMSKVIINGGSFETAGILINADTSSNINISGGTFTQSNGATNSALYIRGNNASLVITGGTINYTQTLYSVNSGVDVDTITYTNNATTKKIS